MSSYDYDLVIVGGGPVGATAARVAMEGGIEVLLIEEHSRIGQPVRCTGLLSRRGLTEAGIGSTSTLREVRGALVQAPNGYQLRIEAPETRAYVLDRETFDQELVAEAKRRGAELWTTSKAVGTRDGELEIVREGQRVRVKARLIIGADGPQSRVAEWSGLGGPQGLIYGLQASLSRQPEREEFVELFLGKDIAPGLFAWAVPSSPGTARVGLGTAQRERLRACFERLMDRFAGDPVTINGGLIPIGPPPRTVADHVLLVGDAAAQAKPTSGGGLYTGIVCAKIAGEVAAKAVKVGDTSVEALGEYEQRWRKLLGRELRFGMLFHRLFANLSDDDLNRIIAALDDPEILGIIAAYGDIDYPSRLVKELAKRPRLWRKLLKLIPAKGGLKRMLSLLGLD